MAKALVVDDNLLQGRDVVSAAQVLGHEAKHVLTLERGLREAQEAEWDVVFLDSGLPDGDGLDAADSFVQALPGARLVAMVPEADLTRARQAEGRNLHQVLRKPVTPTHVAEVLEQLAKPQGEADAGPLLGGDLPLLKEFREHMEQRYLEALIQATGTDVAKALKMAGISRAGYYNLLKKHGLTGVGREE